MIYAIFAIVLLAAGVFGHFLVKRERQKQLARRENKLKIADGKFDDITPEPGPKRSAKLRPGDPGYLMSPPPNLVQRLQKELPLLLGQLFQALKVFKEAEESYSTESANLTRANLRLSGHTFPSSQEAPAQSQWLKQEIAHHQAVAALDCSRNQAGNKANEAHSDMRRIAQSLAMVLQSPQGFDQTAFPRDVQQMLDLSRLLVEELPGRRASSTMRKGEDPWYPRSGFSAKRAKHSQSLITRDLMEMLEDQLDAAFALLAELEEAKLAATGARSQLDQVLAEANPDVPEKPTDEAVQAYIAEAIARATELHDARKTLAKCLMRLKAAHSLFDERMAAVRQTARHANDVALDGGRYEASAELKAANTAVSHLHTLAANASATLSNNAAHAQEAASGEGATEDGAMVESLKSAMRKLAFAVAQSRAAAERLKAAREQEIAAPTQLEPSVDEGSADNYLRRHGQWVKANEQLNAAKQAKSERLAAMQEQEKQRQEQVPQSVLALDGLLAKIKIGQDSSPSLAIHFDAARLIGNQHKPKDKQASSQTSSSSSSKTSAQKAEEKKKKKKRRSHWE